MGINEKDAILEYLTNATEELKEIQQQGFNNVYELWMKYRNEFEGFTEFLADYDKKLEEFMARFKK